MSRKPDYILKGLIKNTEKTNKGFPVGAAWLNDDGSINIQLNPFVVLNGRDNKIHFTLFPNQPWPKEQI